MPLPSCTYSSALLARVLRQSDTPEHPAYVVGGFVRDSLRGTTPPDIDVAVRGDALRIARDTAAAVGGTYVVLKEERRIARVAMPAHMEDEADAPASAIRTLDIVGFEGGISDDLARRDFTINAMAVPAAHVAEYLERPETGFPPAESVIDPYGGMPDLQTGMLRAVCPTVFEDDPARLLRAVRLCAELGLMFDGHTEELIRASAHRISSVSGERSREELLRLLALDDAATTIARMDRLGLLGALIPELEAGRGIEQPTSHFWDVLEHSIQTVAAFEFVAGEGDWPYGNEETRDSIPSQPIFHSYLDQPVSREATHAALIKLACLLHDVAKPQTRTLTETGRARFLGHTKEGGRLSGDILRRLRFSQAESTYVQALVHDHLRPAQMSSEGLPSGRAVFRFFRDTKDAGLGVLYLALADYLACRGPLYTMREWNSVCELTRYIVEEQIRQEHAVRPSRLINGEDIMRLLGIPPGPTVGHLLETILEAQASGQIYTREEALALARETYEQEH